MKKLCISALLLSALLLLPSLSACNRRKEFEELYESRQEASETASVSETNILEVETEAEEYTGPFPSTAGYKLNYVRKESNKGYYEGKTKKELQEMFNPAPGEYNFNNANVNTPLGFIIWTAKGHHAFYNKQTGNISPVCPDPLCDNCIWATHNGYAYVSKEHIYFKDDEYVGEDGINTVLYRCDPERNNIERLYVFESMPTIYYVDGNSLYVCFFRYRADQTAVSSFARLDINTTATETKVTVHYISDENESVEIEGVVGGKVYFRYTDREDRSWYDIYVTDLAFNSPTLAFENGLISGYTDKYIILSEWGDFGKEKVPYTIYNLETGESRDVTELLNGYGLNVTASGNYIYYQKELTEEEINASPLKDYYLYGGRTTRRTGGRLFRMNLDTLEEEFILQLTYNDVPVEIFEVKPDGNICYIEYGTYEEYRNYFNQDSGWDYTNPWPRRHAVVDFSNGTINIFTLDGIDEGIDSILPGP